MSDLRFPPYAMDVRNEQERFTNWQGVRKSRSFYVYVPSERGE